MMHFGQVGKIELEDAFIAEAVEAEESRYPPTLTMQSNDCIIFKECAFLGDFSGLGAFAFGGRWGKVDEFEGGHDLTDEFVEAIADEF